MAMTTTRKMKIAISNAEISLRLAVHVSPMTSYSLHKQPHVA